MELLTVKAGDVGKYSNKSPWRYRRRKYDHIRGFNSVNFSFADIIAPQFSQVDKAFRLGAEHVTDHKMITCSG